MKRRVLSHISAILLLVFCWAAACKIIGNEYILPSPAATFSQFAGLLGDAEFHTALCNTLKRSFYAFSMSVVFGVGLAMLSYLNGVFRTVIAPFISVIRTVPTMAIILMLLIWTTPLAAPVIVTVMVLFPMCYSMSLGALDEVGEEFSLMAKSFKVGLGRQIFKMYLPLAAPMVLSQLGSAFSMGIKIMISSEVLALTRRSMGGMMQQAKMYVEITQLFALTLAAILIGFLAEGLFGLIAAAFNRRKK